jgi:hypothetical protein
MSETYLRKFFFAATVCALGGGIVVAACTTNPPRKSVGNTGTGSGNAGSTGNSTGTAGTTGDATGTAGTGSSTAGTTGSAGDSGAGTAGSSAGTTGSGGSTAGATGTAGDPGPGVAGTNGAAGTGGGAAGTTADTSLVIPSTFPVAVTDYWYPSGWDGDATTTATFATNPPIKIDDMTAATTGPCSKRATGAIGKCFKVTYTPVAGGQYASVALIPVIPGGNMPNYGDATMAPHVPTGAMKITAEVAGDVGGETVQFNLWDHNAANLFMPTFPTGAAAQNWQKITFTIGDPSYDKVLSPFGWSSSSTTPISFYYDDIRIENTP